jgi:hypothetical protein
MVECDHSTGNVDQAVKDLKDVCHIVQYITEDGDTTDEGEERNAA